MAKPGLKRARLFVLLVLRLKGKTSPRWFFLLLYHNISDRVQASPLQLRFHRFVSTVRIRWIWFRRSQSWLQGSSGCFSSNRSLDLHGLEICCRPQLQTIVPHDEACLFFDQWLLDRWISLFLACCFVLRQHERLQFSCRPRTNGCVDHSRQFKNAMCLTRPESNTNRTFARSEKNYRDQKEGVWCCYQPRARISKRNN